MAKVNYKDILDKLLAIWTICYGSITVQIGAGYFLDHLWLPYVGFALIVAIILFGQRNLNHDSLNCSLMTHYTVYILALGGVIMLVLNILNTNTITNTYSEFSHKNYPFHASFIMYPVAALVYAIGLLRQSKPEYCNACKANATFSLRESLRRNVLHHEAKDQMRLAFMISMIMTVVTYIYYFMYYRSNSVDRVYTPDAFFMYILPVVTFAVSWLYMFTKYSGLHFEISLNDSFDDSKRSTRLRFLIISNDKILLADKQIDNMGNDLWDTPADRQIDLYENISLEKVRDIFIDMSGCKHFELRKLFSSNSRMQNINHYAVFVPDDESNTVKLPGKWMTLSEFDMLLHIGKIARALAFELHRIHTITMAWKTYDRDGKRLYPIKNYRPSFRLRDFKDWNVNYEDLHWINVSENNQDKPFYQIRRFWRKYVNGLESRWNGKNT